MVDLGAEARPAEVQWVVQACNEAAAARVCKPMPAPAVEGQNSAPSAELSQAVVVVVRRQDAQGLRIRLELGPLDDFEGESSFRQLRFSPQDPEAERWRSVGFALAVLVGEADARNSGEERLAEAPPNPSTEAESSEAPAAVTAAEPPRFELPFSRSGLFLGAGLVVGEGAGSLRSGVELRGGWLDDSGWQLGSTVNTASVQLREGATEVRWTTLTAGGGYRLGQGGEWALSGELLVGARRLSVDYLLDDLQDSGVVWSPLVSLSTILWWQPLARVGLWAGVDFRSPLAPTRAIDDRDGTVLVDLPLVDTSASVGLWWWM